MSRVLHALERDQRGTALIELGLALPILVTLLLTMVDLSMSYAAKLKLEQAAQSTIESAQQRGYAHSTSSTPTSLGALETEAQERAGAGAVATARAYLECRNGASRTTEALSGSCPGGSTAARYVSVSIAQAYRPIFGIRLTGMNANGTYSLIGVAALRFQ